MSIRFQADNDLKRIIVDATLRREPSIDIQSAQAAGLDRLDYELVLRRASEQGRILVSHDKRTMPSRLAEFLLPDGLEVQKDIGASFCYFVHFFPSRRTGEAWASQHAGMFILSLAEAYAVARHKNEAQYREILR